MGYEIEIIKMHEDVITPKKQTRNSSGFDLYPDLDEPLILQPNELKLIPTGLKLDIRYLEDEFLAIEAQIRTRSSMAVKKQLIVFNSPATIDLDYKGELFIALKNMNDIAHIITNDMRIAQLIFAPIITKNIIGGIVIDKERGVDGLGSSGERG